MRNWRVPPKAHGLVALSNAGPRTGRAGVETLPEESRDSLRLTPLVSVQKFLDEHLSCAVVQQADNIKKGERRNL